MNRLLRFSVVCGIGSAAFPIISALGVYEQITSLRSARFGDWVPKAPRQNLQSSFFISFIISMQFYAGRIHSGTKNAHCTAMGHEISVKLYRCTSRVYTLTDKRRMQLRRSCLGSGVSFTSVEETLLKKWFIELCSG